MSETIPPSPLRARWRRRLRRLALVLLVLITLVALVHAVENFRGQRAWNRYRQDAEARGIKLDYAAHIPAPIPDAENGANTPFIQSWFVRPQPPGGDPLWPTNFYAALTKTLSRKGALTGPGSQDERVFTDLVGWQQAMEYVDAPSENRLGKPTRPARAKEVDAAEQAQAASAVLEKLKIYEPALAELRAMSSRRQVRYPIKFQTEEPFSILLPHLAKIKGIVQVLNLRANAELASGQTNQAFETVKLMLWVCDSVEEETFLISQLVRIASRQIALQTVWEGLARHQWTEAQLKELQERMLHADFVSTLEKCLSGERAGGIATIQWMQKSKKRGEAMAIFDTPEGGDADSALWAKNLGRKLIPKGWFYFEMVSMGQFWELMTADTWDLSSQMIHPRVVDENNRRLREKFSHWPLDALWNHYTITRTLLPALEKSSMRTARAQSTATQAALACALERFYLAEGKYPAALTELVPKYLSKVPHEVVSTEPMRYRAENGGYVLWSAGWDGNDDGGVFLRAAKGAKPEHGDWVWQSAP